MKEITINLDNNQEEEEVQLNFMNPETKPEPKTVDPPPKKVVSVFNDGWYKALVTKVVLDQNVRQGNKTFSVRLSVKHPRSENYMSIVGRHVDCTGLHNLETQVGDYVKD